MYNIPYFKAGNQEEVLAFMKAHPFIMLCGVDANQHPVATHVPVLFEERDGTLYLQAHIMRKQEHTLAYQQNPNVLAIFSGANTYISASWYTNKAVASTWNYQAVHAKGIVRFMDENGLYHLLVNLTNHFEVTNDSPASVKNISESYMKDMMKAIVGFEIEITDIQHVFKLSQNRDAVSKKNIIENLIEGDAQAKEMATIMDKT
ncbi:FMN-binding negative transcriptional regulator [Parasediminibacterium sp. JCM 36343]|uniref:FMN-binding negative transcriptional regulator n=1 Tax=Parasediminibacterium sp. JCM 36343 TaxID=3374279 RepID=UPI00397E045B